MAACLFALGISFMMAMFGPDNDDFADHLTIPTDIEVAEPKPQVSQSHCVITAPPIAVEVFEQSGTKERRMTKAALSHPTRGTLGILSKCESRL